MTLFRAPPGRERYEVRLIDSTSASRGVTCSASSASPRHAGDGTARRPFGGARLVVVARRAQHRLCRLALRNVLRRRGRSTLIVVGLMLATTIIAAALATGDTVSHAMRSTAVAALGSTDEMVSAKGAADNRGQLGPATGMGYFDESAASTRARRRRPGARRRSDPRDRRADRGPGPRQRQNEPRVVVRERPRSLGGFGTIRARGSGVSLADLGARRGVPQRPAARELRRRAATRS